MNLAVRPRGSASAASSSMTAGVLFFQQLLTGADINSVEARRVSTENFAFRLKRKCLASFLLQILRNLELP